MSISTAEKLAKLQPEERIKLLKSYKPEELKKLEYDWNFWARENQKTPEGKWITWLLMAGRGFGKTRVGAEQIIKWKNQGYKHLSLMAKTPAEARDVMIEGESGILNCSPPWDMPMYEPSKRSLTWKNGATALIFSGENYDQARGSQCEKAWIDELAKYRNPQEALDNIMFGLRLGDNPQVIITTTPKPIKTVKELLKDKNTIITRGSTYDNISNLADAFIQTVIAKYENTRLGRQELYAEMLDDNPNALWNRAMIDSLRVKEVPELIRIVIGVDPATTSGEDSDETGIIVAGIDRQKKGYVLEDATFKGSPNEWAQKVVRLYHKWRADRVIGETNQGGDMIETIIKSIDRSVSYRGVHASRGKLLRAEPIAALYEQGKIHHVGYFSDLEDQMCEWQQGDASPNNLDAMVWALTELFNKEPSGFVNVKI